MIFLLNEVDVLECVVQLKILCEANYDWEHEVGEGIGCGVLDFPSGQRPLFQCA